ncbi:MAG: DNA-directed RNA polymerase subunit alpha [Bacteroidetes bacterium QS_7_67_15]|nr:MAG: DNA-directed RNA polymerase subunit alpha [Bacteroidetes bacterium QS_7_67_15]
MNTNHGLQMPEGVQVEDASETFGRFEIEPLERGYGVTIGNALRRVLLSSLRGVAITALKIDGVQHEFSTVPGVTEDVSDIILNLKGVRFHTEELDDTSVHLDLEGPGTWTAADIAEATSEYEVLNLEHHVATLAEDADLSIDLRLGRGRGYVDAEENEHDDDPIGVIAIDSIFTPILSVNYNVTPTRVGQKIAYEKLEVEIETDGSISAEDALTQAAAILRDHIGLFVELEGEPEPEPEEEEVDAEVQRIRELLAQPVDELDLSVRSHNCLKAASIKNIGDLVRREENEMLKFRNFGKKSLQELIEVLDDRGLQFGMDVEKYVEEQASA